MGILSFHVKQLNKMYRPDPAQILRNMNLDRVRPISKKQCIDRDRPISQKHTRQTSRLGSTNVQQNTSVGPDPIPTRSVLIGVGPSTKTINKCLDRVQPNDVSTGSWICPSKKCLDMVRPMSKKTVSTGPGIFPRKRRLDRAMSNSKNMHKGASIGLGPLPRKCLERTRPCTNTNRLDRTQDLRPCPRTNKKKASRSDPLHFQNQNTS